MRLIDADEYKSKLTKLSEFYCLNDTYDEAQAYNAYMNAIEELNEMPTVLKKDDKWTPCAEGLPNQDGEYLVTLQYGGFKMHGIKSFCTDLYSVDEYSFRKYQNKKHAGWYDHDGEWGRFYELDAVIAWKPLGEIYNK